MTHRAICYDDGQMARLKNRIANGYIPDGDITVVPLPEGDDA